MRVIAISSQHATTASFDRVFWPGGAPGISIGPAGGDQVATTQDYLEVPDMRIVKQYDIVDADGKVAGKGERCLGFTGVDKAGNAIRFRFFDK